MSEGNLLPDSTGGDHANASRKIPYETVNPLPRLLKGNPRTVVVHIPYLERQPMVQVARRLTAN